MARDKMHQDSATSPKGRRRQVMHVERRSEDDRQLTEPTAGLPSYLEAMTEKCRKFRPDPVVHLTRKAKGQTVAA